MKEKTYVKLHNNLILEVIGVQHGGRSLLLHTLRKEGEPISSQNTYRVPLSQIAEQSNDLEALKSKA